MRRWLFTAASAAVVAASASLGHRRERVRKMADALGGQPHHLRDLGTLGREREHLGLAHDVLGVVEHLVEPRRQVVQVLGVERRRERFPQRAPQLTLLVVGRVLGSAHTIGRRRRRRSAHSTSASIPSIVVAACVAQHADHVRRLREEPPLVALEPIRHVTHLQGTSSNAASTAHTGSVVTQANSMSRTTRQPTWRHRRRPTPTPTTEDATTCVVETGAPTKDDAKITAVELV